ncbi:MAG: ATP-binding protein [Xanthomonadales bacterium]|nr:ATP-binding protein [Gammaproteobacteria bacterium]NND58287.1 ATP-binding protein [Xanthomonadales bacterium]NNK52002.1 ATP-binding protein [Xanthomonadales bacterium]
MHKKYSRNFDQIQKIVRDTEDFFEREQIDGSLRMKVDLSLEELFVNMVSYNTETDKDILVEMHPIERGIEVSLTDFDVERFDPTRAADVDIDAPLSERDPGGLGLYLVLKMADSINYQYHDRKSKITFTNRVAGE